MYTVMINGEPRTVPFDSKSDAERYAEIVWNRHGVDVQVLDDDANVICEFEN